MTSLNLKTARGLCRIIIGTGIIAKIGGFMKGPRRRVIIVTDRRVVGIAQKVRRSFVARGCLVHLIKVGAGEGLKDFVRIYPLYGKLLAAGAGRDSLIVAVGGGSIGDAIGFVAATYLRGVPWVGVPTTLLSQVDSSVGGKTGINHEVGKNLIGTFHQPVAVICDTQALNTLSQREIISGLGEAIKYGFIYDPVFLKFVERFSRDRRFKDKDLEKVIATSLRWKTRAVQKDEFDLKGQREILNFGHTFGHALESVTKYKRFQHGEAVLWGMRFALALSKVRGHLTSKDFEKWNSLLKKMSVPPLPRIPFKSYLKAMTKDKKKRAGRIHFVLLKRAGKTLSDSRLTQSDLKRAWRILNS